MKHFKCIKCAEERYTEDKFVIVICPACQEAMEIQECRNFEMVDKI